MAQQNPDADETDSEIEQFAESLETEYVSFESDNEATLLCVSRPRFGSERLFIVSKEGHSSPPPQFVDRVENAGYVFLDERTTSEGRWLAVIEPLAAHKQRQSNGNAETPLVRDRGNEGEKVAQMARHAETAVLAFETSRRQFLDKVHSDDVYAGATEDVAAKAWIDCQLVSSSLLGFDYELLDGDDPTEIAAEHLLARPEEAAYARGHVREMVEKTSDISRYSILAQTATSEENEQTVSVLNDYVVKLIGHAQIAESALDLLVFTHPEVDT